MTVMIVMYSRYDGRGYCEDYDNSWRV